MEYIAYVPYGYFLSWVPTLCPLMYLKAKPQMLLNHAVNPHSVRAGSFLAPSQQCHVHSYQSGTLVALWQWQLLLLWSAWQVIMANKKEKHLPWGIFFPRGSSLQDNWKSPKLTFFYAGEFEKYWSLTHHWRTCLCLVDDWGTLFQSWPGRRVTSEMGYISGGYISMIFLQLSGDSVAVKAFSAI